MSAAQGQCIWNNCANRSFRDEWFCASHIDAVQSAADVCAVVDLTQDGLGVAETARLLHSAMERVYRVGVYIQGNPGPDYHLANSLASHMERDQRVGIGAVLGSIAAGTLAERGLGEVFKTKVLEYGSKNAKRT